MMPLGVQIGLFLLGVAVVGIYAWHIFNATERDWQEAKSDDPKTERKE
jgi:hypothetical protein